MKLFFLLFALVSFQNSVAQSIIISHHRLVNRAVIDYPFVVDGREIFLDTALIYAVIYQESRGNPHAKSHAGAYGLMQMMPRTAKLAQCEYSQLHRPEIAIPCGVKFLAALMTYNRGDMVKTLSGYNGGTWNSENRSTHKTGRLAGKIYDNPETRSYVVSVLRLYERFRKDVRKIKNGNKKRQKKWNNKSTR
ncbi:lytic transglycosylase domain-containing protein [bacterium]|nr:lytic transglycosylase domain-containing protein [bacterium]